MIQLKFMCRSMLLLVALCALLRAERAQVSVDFEDGDLAKWILPKPADWMIGSERGNRFLRLKTAGEIGTPRRPIQFAIRKDLCVGDFDLRVKVRRAGKSMAIAFGYQDTLHFYYAHVSADSGNVAVHNGLFKVDGGERFRIGGRGSDPVLGDKAWHQVRLVRHAASGEMVLFVDDDPLPRMAHTDTSFQYGRIGLGSFNETGDYDDFRLEGEASNACR